MTVTLLSLADYSQANKKATFVDQLSQSLSHTGFVRIKDHGLETNTLEQAYTLTKQLFDLPLEVKNQYVLSQLGIRGYTGFGKETANGHNQADLKEFWHIGKELPASSSYSTRYPANMWPNELPEFAPFFKSLFIELERIALCLLSAIGDSFKLDPNYFQELVHEGNSVLRLIHYPATSNMDTHNRMRAAPHADINLLTLLVGATDSGLQLLDKHGKWQNIDSDSNEIVVDTGDMMARITGNTLPATVHQVINPADNTKARYSMPFFLHPHSDAILQRQPQFANEGMSSNNEPAITAGEFLNQRLTDNGLT